MAQDVPSQVARKPSEVNTVEVQIEVSRWSWHIAAEES